MDLVPYQLDPAIQSLKQPRQRILIADAVGLGKTLEAGILVTELIQRGRGKRILVLTLKSMMTQFQKEMWNRFTLLPPQQRRRLPRSLGGLYRAHEEGENKLKNICFPKVVS